MKKVSPNTHCPCGSHQKYKKCCSPYHKGAQPKNALLLMKSRYSAFVAGESHYILKTTHPRNPSYTTETSHWLKDIDSFSKYTKFLGLDIIEFIDGEDEAFVTFRARLSSGTMVEKSHFLKIEGKWLDVDGIFLDLAIRRITLV